MRGVLCVKGMNFHAFHGLQEVERELGQVFSVSLSLGFDIDPTDVVRFPTAQTAAVNIARKQFFIAGTVDEVTAEISCERKDILK